MGEIIDKYHINLFCICRKCKKRENSKKAYSCTEYPKRKGIPAEIWNTENAQCPYYEPKEKTNA